MKTHLTILPRLLFAFVLTTTSARAFDWNAAGKNLGVVKAKNMTEMPIVKGGLVKGSPAKPVETWTAVPAVLEECKAMMFVTENKLQGVVEYEVTKTGWIFFAGFFEGEGKGGAWANDRKDEAKLQEEGWTAVSSAELGGPLTPEHATSEWKVFAKILTAGTAGKLRVNKYSTPGFFTFSQPPTGRFAGVAPAVPQAPPAGTAPVAPTNPVASSPSAPPKPPSRTPQTPAPAPANPPDTSAAKSAALVREYPNSLVFIQGTDGAGSGFIASVNGANYLVTNAHVAVHTRSATLKTLDGTLLTPGEPSAAVDHDIFRIATAAGGSPLQIMDRVEENVSIGDDVVVLGNAEGAGVINTIKGKVVGIGPNLVEVDAPFKPGNSGSPIIHLKTGKVVGVATYATIRKYDSTTKQAISNPVIRRFGYRLDSVKIWQPVNWPAFFAQAAEMQSVEKLTIDLVAFLRDLSASHGKINPNAYTNPAIKNRIDQWADARAKHLSPRDAATADQSFLSFLKLTCQSDVAAAQPHMTYDYFQRQLADHQRERTEIAGVFSKFIETVH
jgi:hypothetical protein